VVLLLAWTPLSGDAVASPIRDTSCPAPGAPPAASAAAGVNQATVTWSAANGGGSPITGYVVRAATGPNLGESEATDGSSTTATLGALGGGSSASFSVAAVSACGTGAPATTASVTPTGPSTTFVARVHADSPVAEYRLTDPGGAIMTDSSGQAADGQYSGQQTLGQPGALPGDPDTSTAYTTCCSGIGAAGPTLPLFNAARTVEAWINTTSMSGSQVIAAYGVNATDQGFVVSTSANSINVDALSDYHSITTPRPLDDGFWHLVTVTYDGTVATAYLDGQLAGSALFSQSLDTLSGPLNVGAAPFGGYNVWSGQLQEVAVYASALSSAQVAAHFAASGYSRPTAAVDVHASYGGSNGAQVSWGHATASNTPVVGYLVSDVSGPNKGETVALSGDATAALLSGLTPGPHTFHVVAFDAYGNGPAAATQAQTVTGAASTYASAVLGDHPVAYWRFSEGSGVSMGADSAGSGRLFSYNPFAATLGGSGAIVGDPDTAVSGSGGSGPGWGQEVADGAGVKLPFYNAARTGVAWVKTPSGGYVVGWGAWGPTAQAFAVWVGGGCIQAVTINNDRQACSSTDTVTDGKWHQVAVSYNGSGSVAFYLDGQSLGSQTFDSSLDTQPSDLVAGAAPNGGGPLGGSLDELSVFPSALSGAQLATLFNLSGYTRPSAPGNPTATAAANEAVVDWSAASASHAPVLWYLVTAIKGTTKVNAVAVPGTATSAQVSGLAAGTAYSFSVQAANAYGYGSAATTTAVTPTGATSTYVSTVLGDGPSVYYRLGDSTAGLMADSSGHGANGVYDTGQISLGTPGAINSDPDTAVTGQGQYVGSSSSAGVPLFNEPRTVEAWINTTDGGEHYIAGWGVQSTTEAFNVATDASDIYVQGYNDDLPFATTTNLADGNWHYVVVTSNGITATAYVDGTSLGTQAFPTPLDTVSSGTLVVGGYTNETNGVNGGQDELAIYPSALTAAQVHAHYTASGRTAPLRRLSTLRSARRPQTNHRARAPRGQRHQIPARRTPTPTGTGHQRSSTKGARR
jgi:hypothetical protein